MSFEWRVEQQAEKNVELEAEAAARQREDRLREESYREQHVTREARERAMAGYSPEDVWGESSPEAIACREFLDYMKEHGLPGIQTLAEVEQRPAEYEPIYRFLRGTKMVQIVPQSYEVVWAVRGYPIGFSEEHPFTLLRRETSDTRYPYVEPHREPSSFQDVFLCEDGELRKCIDGKITPLDSQLGPDTPSVPKIGAITRVEEVLGFPNGYYVHEQPLEELLVEIAAWHTKPTATARAVGGPGQVS